MGHADAEAVAAIGYAGDGNADAQGHDDRRAVVDGGDAIVLISTQN
jgi:hypothetical protein